MGRPKKITNKLHLNAKPNFVQRLEDNKAQALREQEASVNAAVSAIHANTDSHSEESIVISNSDFEPAKEPVKSEEHLITESSTTPGDAERLRLLAQIKASHIGMDAATEQDKTAYITVRNGTVKEANSLEVEMIKDINQIKDRLAAQRHKPEFPKMTIAHFKTLKELERFWTPFKLHGVLYGLNTGELERLADVMREVFEPGYKFDFWCKFCIGEFMRDLYTYFEKWQANQKEELKDYETILQHGTF